MRILRAIPAMFILVLVACGINNVNISISPGQAVVSALSPGQTVVSPRSQVQFSASVGNAGNKTVIWSATAGTIDATGLYTAPSSPGTCYVVATSQADPSKTATAVVTVVAPVVITPDSASLAPGGTQTFTAVIPATGDTNVTWSVVEGASGGTITAGGVYTAPLLEGTYHVMATGATDTSLSATAPVTVAALIAVTPSAVTLAVNTTQAFTAVVKATNDANMTWSVQEASGGTIDPTGLYTAPAAAGTYHVVATSVADSTKSGISVVTVTP